jgi:hypothetical protein
MRCEDFLHILDRQLDGDPSPTEWSDHAAACPRCAFALRIERTLRAAPRWAENPRLRPQRRAAILRKVETAPLFWGHLAAMIQESAASALVAACVVAMVIFAGPALWQGAVPETVRVAMLPYLQPLLSGARAVTTTFEPLVRQGWGAALLGFTGFVVLFAAALSTRALSLRSAG